MDIVEATHEYEEWLEEGLCSRAGQGIDRVALAKKHTAMATDIFPFLRATYYRWAQLLPEVCPNAFDAPIVASVADLHVENFGTWRDGEGRLVWGVNDFDEVARLPYTNDLIRLSVSAKLALKTTALPKKLWRDACTHILDGYRSTLAAGRDKAEPIVLAESNCWLRALAASRAGDPKRFWKRLARETKRAVGPTDEPHEHFSAAREMLKRYLPAGSDLVLCAPRDAGLGSLGHPRYAAIATWRGSDIAREIKTVTPSAYTWASGDTRSRLSYLFMINNAVRSPDPFLKIDKAWVARRLAPDCCRVELVDIPKVAGDRLVIDMGREVANMHLSEPDQVDAIIAHLDSRPRGWLFAAVEAMEAALEADFRAWRKHSQGTGTAKTGKISKRKQETNA